MSVKPSAKEEGVIDILKRIGAIITDSHIVGTSGRHMSVYLNKDALFPYPEETCKVGMLFAKKYRNRDIEVVVAPAMGGIILSQWTAYHLSKLTGRTVHGVFTEKTADEGQEFKRGYNKFVKGKRVLVIEDLTTTGGSVKKVVDTVRKAGGEIVEVCVMANRDEKLANSKSVGAPFASLGVFPAQSYTEAECPMCRENIPINTTVGHGRQFLEKQGRK